MAKAKLRIRWGKHLPGDIIELGPQLYDLGIRRGWVEPVQEEKVIESEYQKKVIEPKTRKKRGR